MTNRRRFLKCVLGLLGLATLPGVPLAVKASGDGQPDDEVDIPVEPCPCVCLTEDGDEYPCDESGKLLVTSWFWSTEYNMVCAEVLDDPAHLICSQEKTDAYFATPTADPATPTASEWEPPVAVEPDDEWWMTIEELPTVGTGSSLYGTTFTFRLDAPHD